LSNVVFGFSDAQYCCADFKNHLDAALHVTE
jgi:hypothetical protein